MKPFTYERAGTSARRLPRRRDGRREVHRRRHQPARPDEARDRDADPSDRRQRSAARQDRTDRRTAACASARWCATPISPPTRACAATIRCCRARCSPAPRGSCATRRPPRATCCSARAARISTTPNQPCNKRQPGSGCAAIGGFNRSTPSSARATPASPRIRATWRSRCGRSTPRSRRYSRDGGARSIPIADFHRLPGDTPQLETVLEPGELITA